jgi:hypothetical protein
MTSMIYGMEYLHVVWVHAGIEPDIFNFSFLFVGILMDERFIFLKLSIFQIRV